MKIHDIQRTLLQGPGGELGIKRTQHIPDSYLKSLDDEREALKHAHGNEFALLCAVPVAKADEWLAQGFNIYTAEPHEIIARLKKDEMDRLVVSS
jgi:hypothetical protein